MSPSAAPVGRETGKPGDLSNTNWRLMSSEGMNGDGDLIEPARQSPENDDGDDDDDDGSGCACATGEHGHSEDVPGLSSSGISLSESILEYRMENGRTYHRYKDGKYTLPNDQAEQERLDLQHNVFLLTFDNRLGLAPPCQKGAVVPGRVLDIGTGTGIWAIDFGDEHPEAEVLGIDLSPSQPTFLPPNVDFEIDDLEEDWVFDEPFDYIHSRLMTSSIADWKEYLQKCYELSPLPHYLPINLAPGGYLELQEVDVGPSCDDGTLDHTTSALARYCALLYDASVKLGRPYQEIPKLADLMRDAEVGFVDVEVKVFKWPTNGWPAADSDDGGRLRELGVWSGENIVAGLEALAMAPFTRAHGWSKEDVDAFLVDVKREMRDESIHAYGLVYSIVGRRPLE
ncbi:hypothetical protein CORC01_05842 [Colletotrichum orchidophilum]|uniref:Methyltransferase domain-containing protein n=1 Tax=Colletotrichum orchidophilum TaxID=1209926 RepID=A0A1G4BC67_9PEZI|nr:uncharacterized protein CORC01_05842 [Colletotrichum orchidophilum]OHE98946.1 hypothetical protein CORC01_05842 [Colletotrichum orchidophilum]